MASVVLGFAGQAVGAAIGGPLGAKIGGYIGSTLGSMIDNKLFPQKAEGPRLDDLTVSASSYGRPIALLFGPENRIAGNIIWSTGLIETAKKTKSGGKGGPTVVTTEYTYRASLAILLAEGVLDGVSKVWANNKLIYDAGGPVEGGALFGALRFYPGTLTQNPDPTIEAELGVGMTPAYRGSCYVVFEDLQLADFGNRIPNLEFLVIAQTETSVGAVVEEILVRCGIDTNLVSTVSLTEPLRGFTIGSPASGIGALQPLALAFNFDVAEVGGGLRCSRRGASVLGVVLKEQLAGYADSGERPAETLRWSRAQVTSLPREATITFPDPERDWQANSQRARRSQGSADSNLQTEIAVVMTADAGRRLADRMLWEAWTGMQSAEATTDDRWISMEPGRTYLFETPAGFEPLRLLRKTRGANGLIEIAVTRDQDAVYQSTARGVVATVPPNPLRQTQPSLIILLDIPLLLDADEPQGSGFYWGVVSSAEQWRGANGVRGLSALGPYEQMDAQGRELTLGTIDAGLVAPGPGFDSAVEWDNVTVVRVTLARPDMRLESLTDAEVLAGGNAAFAGASGPAGEVFQFANADMVEPGVYDLSRLRRGQRGTEFAWDDHAAGERFVLLDPGALIRSDFGLDDLNLPRFYKSVSLLTLEVDAETVPFTNTGVGLRPYSPEDLLAEGVSGGPIELTWKRRSRIGAGSDPLPLAEVEELYLLQIMNGAVVVRSVSVPSPDFDYTEAMQLADFGALQTSLAFRVAQVSAAYGPGPFAFWSGVV